MAHPNTIIDRPPADIIHDQDFIAIYRGLDPELCRSITDLFDRDERKWRGKIGLDGRVAHQDDFKRSWDLEILNEGAWRDIFQRIHPRILACLSHYLSRSPILQSFALQGTGYKIQMYPRNQGFFHWHADSVGSNSDRMVAMVLYLNDVEKGGETEFFHQKLKISPKAGHLLLFPAAWNYMHRGHIPESNDKYIISTFIKIKH